jgi:predicted dienelactone hydrolase
LSLLRSTLFATFVACATAGPALAGVAEMSAPGPYGVGVRTVTLSDATRGTNAYGNYYAGLPAPRNLPVEVWYPADTGQGTKEVRDAAPAASGSPWPIIVRAHGLAANRRDAVYLTTHLASHGYVVVAPDFPLSKINTPALIPIIYDVAEQAHDVAFVAEQAGEATVDALKFLAGRVDGRRIGTLGHSLGGLTVLLDAYHPTLSDDSPTRTRAVAALAPWACSLQDTFFGDSTIPALWMGGDADLITPYASNQQSVFARASTPRILATLDEGTHVNFSTSLLEIPEGKSPDDEYCDETFIFLPRPLQTPGMPESLGGKPNGIDDNSCGKICPKAPDGFMDEDRQHQLVRAAVLAFFESELRGSVDAHHTLVEGLDAEPDAATELVEGECPFASCAWENACTSCGQPVSIDAEAPGAGDALFVLQVAVGLADCPACVCDVDANLVTTSADALAVLRRAVSIGGDLACLRATPVGHGG